MQKNRDYFKNLLADHALDQLFDELFAQLVWHKNRYQNRATADKYDELVLLSGKLNSVEQSLRIGTISPEEMNTEFSRINAALLELLNDLPDAFFLQTQEVDTAVATGAKKLYTVPSGLRNGLFWTGAVFMLMICLGSLNLKNWATFAFTLLATLICMPLTFDYFADKLRISLSGSVRVMLVFALAVTGLLLAPKREAGKADPAGREQPEAPK